MYYSVDGKHYWVEVHGKGEPVLLLHGFTGSRTTWDPFVAEWQKEFKVVTIDLPGHGKTKTNKIVHMTEFCEDLNSLLLQLEFKRVSLVGYSLGGRTALSFAFTHPGSVKSLVLESASPGLRTSREQLHRKASDEQLATKIESEGIKSFVDDWQRIPLFESQLKLSKPIKDRIREERLSQSEQGLSYSLKGMGTGVQPSWWERLPELTMEVLLIAGELDGKFVDIAHHMNDSIKTSKLKIVANAGHAVHVEQAQEFDTIVKNFIKD